MKHQGARQILVALDEQTAGDLERVAPARSRQRSEFIRMAIRRALWELDERKTAAAYALQPDGDPAYFDAAVWEPAAPKKPVRRRR